jgi:NADPH-dependent 7-cyano-7-deazaguanine reductase QueF
MSSKKLYKENKDYKQTDLEKIRKELAKKAPLEVFKFKPLTPGDQWVHISTPEFTAICLELKSFKLYINAFRDVKIFHEAVTEVIFADFLEAVKPKKAYIVVDMNVRGNVKTVCEKRFKC